MHRAALLSAGFADDDVSGHICRVNPPADCAYWRQPTLPAPIVRKRGTWELPSPAAWGTTGSANHEGSVR